MSDEKTEQPTAKKLQDANKEGQHAKSADVTAAIVMGGMVLALTFAGESIAERVRGIVDTGLTLSVQMRDPDASFFPPMIAMAWDALQVCLALTALAVLLGLVGMAAQVGLNISFKPLEPKFEKLNPATNLKNLVSIRSLIDLVKMMAKAIVLVFIVWTVMKDLLPVMVGASYLSPMGIVAIAWAAALKLLWSTLILFAVVGPIDYGLQRWQFIRGQKMSKDEIKREHKDSEGDPLLKAKRKQIAREMVNSNPKQAVASSSVVLTNPTHYAVAIRYQAGATPVPVVAAKGMDEAAAAIRGYAQECGVPIVGDPPLARALHKIPVDQPIPEELFEAVAAVVNWVMLVKQIELEEHLGKPQPRPPQPTSAVRP